MKKKATGKYISLILAVLILIFAVVPVQADGMRGTIKIFYHGAEEGEDKIPLSDLLIKLYYVGTSGKGGELAEEFQESGLSLENLEDLSVSEQQAQAYQTALYAKKNVRPYAQEATDSQGSVQFVNLPLGLYLAVPQDRYYTETGSFLTAPFFISLPLNGSFSPVLNPKTQWEHGLVISTETLTVYTGGNELHEGTPDGFPQPRYTGIEPDTKWKVNEEIWNKEGYPFEVYYTKAEDDEGKVDTGVIAEDDEIPGVYISHIQPLVENAVITASKDDFLTEQKVTFQTGLLIVRNTNENKNENQLGEIVSGASSSGEGLTPRQLNDLKNGVGTVVVPDDTVITVNGREELGTVRIEDAGLLFDELLYYGTKDSETGALVLEERAEQSLKDSGQSVEFRKYQSRYLDLVAHQDGNLWLSSSKGVDVYWPYPEGTDEDTEFTLFHFRGLHREYAIMGNPDLESQVKTAPMEQVKIEKTENGILFHIPESGFSPFVLSWTEGNENPIENIINSVKTGDNTPIVKTALILGISGGLCIILYVRQKKQKQ